MPHFSIDAAGDAGPLPHFWRSTGFTPSSLVFDPALIETLDHCTGRMVRGRTDAESVILRWNPMIDSHQLLSWRVEVESGGIWQAVDHPATLAAMVRFPRAPTPGGCRYRVIAEDVWGRRSLPSETFAI